TRRLVARDLAVVRVLERGIERRSVREAEEAVEVVHVVRIVRIERVRGVRTLNGEHRARGVDVGPSGRLRPVEEVEHVHPEGEGVRLRQLDVEREGTVEQVETRGPTGRATGEEERLTRAVEVVRPTDGERR